MNVLINLGTLKKGGGQNVGLNFVQSLETLSPEKMNFFFAVSENTDIYKYLKKNNKELIIVPQDPFSRMFFEKKNGGKIVSKYKIDIIYTVFGIGLYPKKTPQISGSADSNLYFPEIDFWSEYNGLSKFLKKCIDFYRIKGIQRATAVVFENEEMERRCKQIFQIKETKLILPSINTSFQSSEYKLPEKLKSIPKGLFLCGWQRNKNFMLIPEIASHIKKKGGEFHFLITATKDNSLEHNLFIEKMNKLGVHDMIEIIGRVKKEELKSLYNQIDIVFLLSKLESFSNNIIEAWTFKKTLMISDAAWSRGICKNAALYVNRDNAALIADNILELIRDTSIGQDLINNGIKILEDYPTIHQRTEIEINYIKEIYEKYC